MKNHFTKTLVLLGVLSIVSPIALAEGDVYGKKLYKTKTCFACHSKGANKAILDYPNLAGQNAKYSYKQMKDIASGKRLASPDVTGNPRTGGMKGVMHLVNDGELKKIAKWLETLEKFEPKKGAVTASVEDLAKGKKLYKKFRCATCHGKGGAKPRKGDPYLAGQKKAYMVNQMLDIKNKIRTNSKSKTMIPFVKKVSEEDMNLIAAYLEAQGVKK